MRLLLHTLLLSFIFPVAAHAAEAQPTPLTDHFIERWDTRSGLPHNTVNGITQTDDGYIWFATWEGVARFNGREFVVFDRNDFTNFPDAGIRALALNQQGKLLIGSARGGLINVEQDEWIAYPQLPTLVNVVAMDVNGDIWAGTHGAGVFRQDKDGTQTQYVTSAKHPDDVINALVEIPNKGIVVGTSAGVYLFRDEGFEPLTGAEDISQVLSLVWSAREDKLYIGTETGPRIWHDSKISQPYPQLEGKPISEIMISHTGNIWLGSSDQGVWRISGRGIEHLDVDSGLPNNRIVDIFQDRERSVWIGTNGGLVRLRDALFSNLLRSHGLSDNFSRTVLTLPDDSLLIGTSRGLNHLYDNEVSHIGQGTSLADESILSLAINAQGQYWVGTYSGGAYQWDPEAQQVTAHYQVENGLPANEVRALHVVGDTIWIGTARGLIRVVNGDVIEVTREHGLPGNFIVALKTDKRQRLWVGTGDGVAIIDNPTATRPEAKALPIFDLDEAVYTFGFYEDDDAMWMATDRGLIRYGFSDKSLYLIGRAQGLPFDKYFSVVEDQRGHFWLSANRGIIRFSRASVMAVIAGEQEQVDVEVFGEMDGMSSAQANGGSSPAGATRADGSVWFPTAMGVVSVHPERIHSFEEITPPIVIERFAADGRELAINQLHTLPHSINRIEFQFAGLGFVMPQRIRYRTRLLGFDNEWMDRNTLNSTEYTNLPPGEYVFQVTAEYPNATGRDNQTEVSFVIEPAFYQLSVFWIGVIVLTILIIVVAYRTRLGRLSRNEQRLRQLVKEQTFELERQAREDQLTRLPNRRAFDEHLAREFARSQRKRHSLCLAIMDLDHFKHINDHFSHGVGDEILRRVADTLRKGVRTNDIVARWGGEEFMILVSDSSAEELRDLCERLRRDINQLDCADIAEGLIVTASFGIAAGDLVDDTAQLLIRADAALYKAKQAGRNRVC